MAEDTHWTNYCSNIHNYCAHSSNVGQCMCYADYCLWSKDNPKLDFTTWRDLVKIEMENERRDNL